MLNEVDEYCIFNAKSWNREIDETVSPGKISGRETTAGSIVNMEKMITDKENSVDSKSHINKKRTKKASYK